MARKFGHEKILACINQCFTENDIARNWYHGLPSDTVIAINTSLETLRETLKRVFFLPRPKLRKMADKEIYTFADERTALQYLYKKVRLCRMASDGVTVPDDLVAKARHDQEFEAELVAKIHDGIREPQLQVMLHAYATVPTATVDRYASALRDVMTPCKEQYERMHSIVQGYISQSKVSSSSYNRSRDREPRRIEYKSDKTAETTVRKDKDVLSSRIPKMIGKSTRTFHQGSKLLRTCQYCDGEHYDKDCTKKEGSSGSSRFGNLGVRKESSYGRKKDEESKAIVPFKCFFAGFQDTTCEEEEDNQCVGYFSDEDAGSVVSNESSTHYSGSNALL